MEESCLRCSGSGVSATLSLLAGREKGALCCLSFPPSCDGLRTNGDCRSGVRSGEVGFVGDARFFVGEVDGVVARTVDGVRPIGDSGRLNGDGRGEKDMLAVFWSLATAVELSVEGVEVEMRCW